MAAVHVAEFSIGCDASGGIFDVLAPIDAAVPSRGEAPAGRDVAARATPDVTDRRNNGVVHWDRTAGPARLARDFAEADDGSGPLPVTLRNEHEFEEIVGRSRELLRLLDRVRSAAPTDANVLIIGETGSGKELIARAIHSRSLRRNHCLVKVNCGAIPAGLVESELFGHVKGAFTSAIDRRVGRFEMAHNGTIFLDEVGELPLETQVTLLRVLQEQEFEPVGSSRTIKVNVRVVAATNRDLAEAVKFGKFRADLYYRLNVIPLNVPPLRDRRSDIPEMVRTFLQRSAERMGKPVQGVSEQTMRVLVDHSWPGNIRELQNVIERGVVLSNGPILRLGSDLLPLEDSDTNIEQAVTAEERDSDSLEEIQRQHILRVLERTGWVISGPNGAGAVLDLHPNTLRSLMSRLGIDRPLHRHRS